jgi:hypothetical protein
MENSEIYKLCGRVYIPERCRFDWSQKITAENIQYIINSCEFLQSDIKFTLFEFALTSQFDINKYDFTLITIRKMYYIIKFFQYRIVPEIMYPDNADCISFITHKISFTNGMINILVNKSKIAACIKTSVDTN